MRTNAILLLAAGLSLLSCSDTTGPATATLRVSTHTQGDDPDQDGYQLRMDDASLDLAPTGTARIALTPGRRTLRLLGVASHCSVAPAATLEVDILSDSTTSVAFEINCPGTGVRISTEATGLDFDRDGYRVVVDGSDLAGVPSQGSVYVRLDPGSRTITLADLAPNCTIAGSASRVVTIRDAEVVPVGFTALCTGTSGVVQFVISGRGAQNQFMASVDGGKPVLVGHGPRVHLADVPAGEHVVSLSAPPAPPTCSVRTNPQSVTVTAGTLIRDTVDVAFTVSCQTTLLVTAPTTGDAGVLYSVWACHDIMDGCDWGPVIRLGSLAPNDTLIVEVGPGRYELYLNDLPPHCHVNGRDNPKREVTIDDGELLSIAFRVVC